MPTDQLLPTFWMKDLPYDWGMLEKGPIYHYKKNEILFLEGEKMETIFLIKKGRVKLSVTNENGQEKNAGFLGANSIVGTSSLFNNAQYMFTATAITSCLIWKFDKDEFIKKVLTEEKLMLQVFKIMSLRIRTLTNHTLDLSFEHSLKRLCTALLEMSEAYGISRGDGTIYIDFNLTQRELGELIGTTWVTVSNHLRKLQEAGIITKEKKNYIILDLDALKDVHNHKFRTY